MTMMICRGDWSGRSVSAWIGLGLARGAQLVRDVAARAAIRGHAIVIRTRRWVQPSGIDTVRDHARRAQAYATGRRPLVQIDFSKGYHPDSEKLLHRSNQADQAEFIVLYLEMIALFSRRNYRES